MDKLEVNKFHVVGTSYGGFVAYHLANMFGEERVQKVVIASSAVNMTKSDNVGLLERAGLEKIEDLMLPATPQHLRKLMSLSVSSKRVHMMPDFFLKDFLNVSSFSFFFLLSLFSFYLGFFFFLLLFGKQ